MIRIKLLISSFFMMSFQLLFSNNHFIPAYLEFSDNPYLPHNITITSAILNGVDLESGDEIGIFDGDVCVGSGVVDDLISAPSNMLALVASAQDGSTPGFTALNEISYRFWDSSAMSEISDVSANYLQGNTSYTLQGSSYVSLVGLGEGVIDEEEVVSEDDVTSCMNGLDDDDDGDIDCDDSDCIGIITDSPIDFNEDGYFDVYPGEVVCKEPVICDSGYTLVDESSCYNDNTLNILQDIIDLNPLFPSHFTPTMLGYQEWHWTDHHAHDLNELELIGHMILYLPSSIGDLDRLTSFILKYTQVTSLPSEIGNLNDLTYLDLSHNKLETLPESIGQLHVLEELMANGNDISEIPSSIGLLNELNLLHLNDNDLHALPVELCDLSIWSDISLHGNNLCEEFHYSCIDDWGWQDQAHCCDTASGLNWTECSNSGCMDSNACNYDANAEEDDGSCEYVIDCNGDCGGSAIEDCNGTCDGNAYLDDCQHCDEDPSNDCMQDCAGIWGGDAVNDEYCKDLDGDGLGD